MSPPRAALPRVQHPASPPPERKAPEPAPAPKPKPAPRPAEAAQKSDVVVPSHGTPLLLLYGSNSGASEASGATHCTKKNSEMPRSWPVSTKIERWFVPGVGMIILILAPYIDKNPSNKPEDRKFATSLMTVHLMFWAVLVIIGSFFRGQGFNFVFPWNDGIFFEL